VGVTLPPYAGDGAGNAARGRQVFASACQSCHGPDGTGHAAVGSITDASYLALVSDQALRNLVIAGRPDLGHPDWRGYPPGRPLTTQQVSDVVAWLSAQRGATRQDAARRVSLPAVRAGEGEGETTQ